MALIIASAAGRNPLAVLLDMSFAHVGYWIVVISRADMADHNKSRWSGLGPRLALKLASYQRVADMTADMARAAG